VLSAKVYLTLGHCFQLPGAAFLVDESVEPATVKELMMSLPLVQEARNPLPEALKDKQGAILWRKNTQPYEMSISASWTSTWRVTHSSMD